MAKRHYDATPAGNLTSRSLCGWFGGQGFTTTDPESVTCKVCRRRLASSHVAEVQAAAQFEGDYVHDSDFLEATRDPLPVGPTLTRAQRAVWRHVFDGVARLIAGESEREGRRLAPPTRFGGVGHALAEMVQARIDGYPAGTLSDPKRLLRQSEFGYQPAGGAPSGDRAIQLAEDLHHVRQAWEAAYGGDWRGLLSERDCREACLRRYVGGETVSDIAESLTERFGYAVKRKLVGAVTRAGYGRIWEHLGERGLIPLARPARKTAEDHMAEQQSDRPKPDVFEWRGVAEYFGVHVDTAKTWHRRWPMPLRKFGGRIMASSVELDRWQEEHTEDLAS